MAQIIQQAPKPPSVGEMLGQLLGTTLGGVAGGAAEGYRTQMQAMQDQVLARQADEQERQRLRGVMEELGLSPTLSELPPDLQKEFIKQKFQKDKQSQLMELLGGMTGGGAVGEGRSGSSAEAQIPDEQILLANLIDPNIARTLQSQKKTALQATESQAKRHFERAKPILARADERAEAIIPKENSLTLMENALKEADLSFFSPDNLAEMTGIEAFRTPSGAQFISSGKEFFLGSLKRAGARPNQWIERQIQKMLPKIGRSREANLTVAAALRSEIEVDKEYQNILNRLVSEDEARYGYIRGDIGQRARKGLQKFSNEEQSRLEQTLREIQVAQKGMTQMRDPDGNIRSVPKDDVKAAKAAGYSLQK
jgi:hypothetical protein